MDFDEISFFKYLSISFEKIQVNFIHLISLIIVILNEVSLVYSTIFPLNQTINEKYLIFFQKIMVIANQINEWSLISKVFGESVKYFEKKIKSESNLIVSQNFKKYINDFISIISEKKLIIFDEFLKKNNDTFTRFITFLKFLKNIGIFIFYDSLIMF